MQWRQLGHFILSFTRLNRQNLAFLSIYVIPVKVSFGDSYAYIIK